MQGESFVKKATSDHITQFLPNFERIKQVCLFFKYLFLPLSSVEHSVIFKNEIEELLDQLPIRIIPHLLNLILSRRPHRLIGAHVLHLVSEAEGTREVEYEKEIPSKILIISCNPLLVIILNHVIQLNNLLLVRAIAPQQAHAFNFPDTVGFSISNVLVLRCIVHATGIIQELYQIGRRTRLPQAPAPRRIVFEGVLERLEGYVLYLPQRAVRLLLVGDAHAALYEQHEAVYVHFVEGEGLFEPLIPPQFLHLSVPQSLIAVPLLIKILQILCFFVILFPLKGFILLADHLSFTFFGDVSFAIQLRVILKLHVSALPLLLEPYPFPRARIRRLLRFLET